MKPKFFLFCTLFSVAICSLIIAQGVERGVAGQPNLSKKGLEGKSKAKATNPGLKDSFSYAIGVAQAKYFASAELVIDFESFRKGYSDFFNNRLKLSDSLITTVIQKRFQTKQNEKAELGSKEAQSFFSDLKKNSKASEILPGLFYEVIRDSVNSNGSSPVDSSKVKVHYIGSLVNGTEFDNSYKRGEPAIFPVSGLVKGFSEALKKMKVGQIWKIYIDPSLGYGIQGAGKIIPPNSALIFHVELLEVL